MIVSLAVVTIRKGHDNQVLEILNKYVTGEKSSKGCIKAYVRKALNNVDTFMVLCEYDTLENFQAADQKSVERLKEGGTIDFVLRPHVIKAFYGNFE